MLEESFQQKFDFLLVLPYKHSEVLPANTLAREWTPAQLHRTCWPLQHVCASTPGSSGKIPSRRPLTLGWKRRYAGWVYGCTHKISRHARKKKYFKTIENTKHPCPMFRHHDGYCVQKRLGK